MASTNSQTVNITVPKALLKQVDALAKRDYTSRSDIIRQALLDKIRKTEVDEWGDSISENWQTLVDFRGLDIKGVPAKDVTRAMRQLLNE